MKQKMASAEKAILSLLDYLKLSNIKVSLFFLINESFITLKK
jgi:hypothetical protein